MNIGLVFGWSSVEHDISIISAYVVAKEIKHIEEHKLFYIYISSEGKWFLIDEFDKIGKIKTDSLTDKQELFLDLTKIGKLHLIKKGFTNKHIDIDLVFPVMHWLRWEDGTIQWLCELFKIPFASTSCLASAVWMNKKLMKDVFKSNAMPLIEYICFSKDEKIDKDIIIKQIGFPLFVKPTSWWSSIGVSKVNRQEELDDAIELAFYYDNEIMVEKSVENLIELNCSVMETDGEIVSTLVEQPITQKDFLSFEAKYIDAGGWSMSGIKDGVKIPAEIPEYIAKQVQEGTKKIYKILECNGWAPRIDRLYDQKNDKLYVNEINCIPGSLQLHLRERSWHGKTDVIQELIKTASMTCKKRQVNIDFQSNIISYSTTFNK